MVILLANGSVDALAHWPFCLVLVSMIYTFALVLLLDASGSKLESCQIHRVRVHNLFRNRYDVGDETVEQV